MVVAFRDGDEIKSGTMHLFGPKTANKDKTVQVGKMTVGSQWGAAGLIYAGGDDKVIVAEGAETACLVEVEPMRRFISLVATCKMQGHYGTLALLHGQSTITYCSRTMIYQSKRGFKATLPVQKNLQKKVLSL